MQTALIFACVWGAMIANSFWEAYVEGRNPWGMRKLGWTLRLGKFTLPAYHFYLFFVTYPLLLAVPLVAHGWDTKLFGILVSAYASGLVIEDFLWFVVNPVVRLKEFWTPFSDFYPWIKLNGKKIIPLGYPCGLAIALLSWFFLWS